jgi:hypothetical protein
MDTAEPFTREYYSYAVYELSFDWSSVGHYRDIMCLRDRDIMCMCDGDIVCMCDRDIMCMCDWDIMCMCDMDVDFTDMHVHYG